MKKLFQRIYIVFVILSTLSCQSTGDNSNDISNEGMVLHCVYFYLEEEISEEEKKSFEKGLHELLAIDVIYKSEIGKTGATPSRAVTDHDFDYSIVTWFKTLKDYETYANHPDHIEFIGKYEMFWEYVKVYDSEII